MKFALGYKVFRLGLLLLALSTASAQAQVLSFDQAKQRADQGDAFAQAVVALHYQLGWNTQKNPQLAAKYALASANAGHPYGLFRLGSLYVAGNGVEKNPDLGYKLQSQAGQGLSQLAQDRANPDPYAMTAIGIANFQGKITPQNRAQAAEWYKAAASYGFAPAVFNYIMCEVEGQGLPKHPATHTHFVKQEPYSGSGCTCAHCNGPAPGHLYPQLLANYPPAQDYIAENLGKVERDAQLAASLHDAPILEEEYWNGSQNPQTAVFEPPSLRGKSSTWHRLMTAASSSVKVDVRANYTGLSKSPEFEFGEDYPINSSFTHESWLGNEGLFSNLQFVVVKNDEGLLIRPNSPLAKKNRMGLCEYPIALEFRVSNNGAKAVRLDSLGFDVKQSRVRESSLPGLVFQHGDVAGGFLGATNEDNAVVVHNFGWSPFEEGTFAKLGLLDRSLNRAEYREVTLESGPSTRVLVSELNFSPVLLETLDTHPLYADRVMSLEVDGIRAWFEPNFSRNPRDFYTRIDGDARLPVGRTDYRLRFDVLQEIKAGEAAVLNVTFDFDQSVDAILEPAITIDGETFAGSAISCEYECLNHYAPPRYTFAIDGNGDVPVGRLQDSLLGLSPEDGQRCAEKLAALTSSLADQTVLKPRLQAATNFKINDGTDQEHILFQERRTLSGEKTFKITGSLRGTAIHGHAMLLAGSDGETVFKVPWSFTDVPAEEGTLRISVVRGFSDQWCAWFVRIGDRGRLYTIFPGKNATVFTPIIPDSATDSFRGGQVNVCKELEDDISQIGIDKSGNSFVIQNASERNLLPLGSRLMSMLQETINAEGMGVVMLYGSDMADSARVVLKVPATKFNGEVDWSEFQEVQIPKCEKEASLVTGILWPTNDTLAIKSGGVWDLWRLHFGTVSSAHTQEALSFDAQLEKVRQPVAELLSKINQARHSLTGQDWDSRVRNAFVVDVGSALLLVGQEGMLRGAAPDEFPRSGLAFEFYNKSKVDFWPDQQFVLNPFGVRKQFAEFSEFFGEIALSPDGKRACAVTKSGNAVYIVDISAPPSRQALLASNVKDDILCAVRSPINPQKFSIVRKDGSYLSGDGSASGLVVSDGHNALSLSQLEAKHNRPDIVLEELLASEELISEAKRLRERFVRRSDFKSFDGATLIDIPVVTVKSEVPEKTGEKSLSLDFEASNSTGPLKELRVFNNGALVKTLALKGMDGQPSLEATGEVQIDLASGENRLQLMAVSEEGFTSSFAEKRVNCTAEPDSRRCFIAAVGVSEYSDPRFNLKFAAKDAEDISKVLAEKARHRGYQSEVLVVKNAEVDSGLVDKLREFLSQAGTDDEVVLFFAGHGLLDKDLEYHFARHDTDFDATENMGITFEALESLVDGIKPLKRTVLFDTCHSGEVEEEDKPQLLAMVGSGDLSSPAAADSGVQVRGVATRGMKVTGAEPKLRHADFVELEGLFPDSRRAKGANILTSSSGSEFSMESDAWQNGLFTYAFLNALQDEKTDTNADHSISFKEAAEAVQNTVQSLSGGNQRPITRGVNRETEVTLARFEPHMERQPVRKLESKVGPVDESTAPPKEAPGEKKSGWWP